MGLVTYNRAMPLDDATTRSRRIVRAACPHDCPDTCAMLVTVEDGRAIDIRGAPDHPPTAGTLCTKVARYLDRTYSPDRVRHPMRRIGAKGEGRFARISWDEALDEIAERFRAIAESADGPQAILPYSYAGTMGLLQGSSMDRRFFHRLGASLLDRTICSAAGKAGWAAVIGASVGMDVEAFVDSRLILIWGSNPITSSLHFWSRAQEAKRRGAKLVAIDPYRSATAQKCHAHIALLPGTDGALALALMHVLMRDGFVDRDYVDRHTVGYDPLRERADEWTPERAAQVIRASRRLNIGHGVLIAVPVPEVDAMSDKLAEAAIRQATDEAEARGIHGKDVTPFVLARVAELTEGVSRRANTALLVNNARVGGLIAAALAGTDASNRG